MGRFLRRISTFISAFEERSGQYPLLSLRRAFYRDDSRSRIKEIRRSGASGDVVEISKFVSLLSDPVPGVRRCAAWSLGMSADPTTTKVLFERSLTERCDEVRFALAVACVRCGGPVSLCWDVLTEPTQRTVPSWYGPKRMSSFSSDFGDLAVRWTLALNPKGDSNRPESLRPVRAEEIRSQVLDELNERPNDPALLRSLAILQHPMDFELLDTEHSGRGSHHARVERLGIHGDPRAIPTIVKTLRAIDVDPSRGYTSRAAAATALGRIGSSDIGGVIARAIADEIQDHEGRPGAGLGVQFPVISLLIEALGEVGDRAQASTLIDHLGHAHGSARGGLYLPAMIALWKLDTAAVVASLLRCDDEFIVSNALAALGAMGCKSHLIEWVTDPRTRIRDVVQCSLSQMERLDDRQADYIDEFIATQLA